MFGNVISVLAGHISVTWSDGTKCFQGSPAAVWVMWGGGCLNQAAGVLEGI